MKPEVVIAQLCIVDGAWQEAPDYVAQFEERALFEGTPGRGSLFVVCEVTGDPDGRDALARELIETTRREYAASRGSIMLGLAQAVRAANDVLYNQNSNVPREARRIAGMTSAILREGELFVAQGGPGLTCLLHDETLRRFPEQSPWFNPDETALGEMLASRNFPTEGTVPLGMRHTYTPDQFHITLQLGDTVLLSTPTLMHLLSDEELLDTLAHRHPDEMMTNLEDLAGATDLSVIAIQLADVHAAITPVPVAVPAEASSARLSVETPSAIPDGLARDKYPPEMDTGHETKLASTPSNLVRSVQDESRQRAAFRPNVTWPRIQIDWARVRAGILRFTAGAMAALASVFSRVDWKSMSTAADRTVSNISRMFARVLLSLLRSVLPGEPQEVKSVPSKPPALEAGWRLLAVVFPILLMAAGGWMWFNTRAEQQRAQAAQVSQLITQAKTAIEAGKALAPTDKNGARDAFQKAIALTNQVQTISPTDTTARTVYYSAQDELDTLNGISVLFFLPSFATYSDSRSNPARIVVHYPDVYVLDRGTSRVYHYVVNDAGPSITPTPADGIVLKFGDKTTDQGGVDRTVGELIDLIWVEPGGRLIAIDKTGAFLEYDPSKNIWKARTFRDATQWSQVSLATDYAGNLYLVDAGRNQILKYVATEGAWTSSVTYFAPGVNVDLSSVNDIAIDGDVWLARGDGSIARFTQGRPNDLTIRDLDTPLSKSVAIFTTEKINNVYVADAGNQRIVQIDKTTGRFARQFKPTGQYRDAFNSLKALAVDEPNKKFFFINGNQAYLATIPQ